MLVNVTPKFLQPLRLKQSRDRGGESTVFIYYLQQTDINLYYYMSTAMQALMLKTLTCGPTVMIIL